MSGNLELMMVAKRTFVHVQLTPMDTPVSRRSRTTSDLCVMSWEEDPSAKQCQCFRTCKLKTVQSVCDCATSLGDGDVQVLESDSDQDASEVELSSPDPSPRSSMSSCSTSPATPPGSFTSLPLRPSLLGLFPLAVVPVAFPLALPMHAAISYQSQSLCSSGSMIGGTTLLLKNLPPTLCREALLRVLDEVGFHGRYDFAYLPTDMSQSGCYCYAFINMISHEAALDFLERLEGFCAWPQDSGRAIQVLWSDIQGQQAYIDKYRNSTVMHESVPEHCKPVLFHNGSRVPFPAPTQRIKAPRLRNRTPAETSQVKV